MGGRGSLEWSVQCARKVYVPMMEKDQIQMRVLKLVPVTQLVARHKNKKPRHKNELFFKAQYSSIFMPVKQ